MRLHSIYPENLVKSITIVTISGYYPVNGLAKL